MVLKFALPSEDHILGIPVGKHVTIHTRINGKYVIRSYTPITTDDIKGYVEFMIKIYWPTEENPRGGLMSHYLSQCKVGDFLNFRGPCGIYTYETPGKIRIDKDDKKTIHKVKEIGMIAGGTGITPLLQIMRCIFRHVDEDDTKISVLYAARTWRDILYWEELERLTRTMIGQFRINYTVEIKPTVRVGFENWPHFVGLISKDMLKKTMPRSSKDMKILVCGPPGMIRFACLPNLKALGYTRDQILCY